MCGLKRLGFFYVIKNKTNIKRVDKGKIVKRFAIKRGNQLCVQRKVNYDAL